MALIETIRVAPISASHSWVASVSAKFSAWNDARATRKVLSQLTARELDDIGLIPGDIDAISRR